MCLSETKFFSMLYCSDLSKKKFKKIYFTEDKQFFQFFGYEKDNFLSPYFHVCVIYLELNCLYN